MHLAIKLEFITSGNKPVGNVPLNWHSVFFFWQDTAGNEGVANASFYSVEAGSMIKKDALQREI